MILKTVFLNIHSNITLSLFIYTKFKTFWSYLFSGYLYINICLYSIMVTFFIYSNNAKNAPKTYIVKVNAN